jgi:hypothetical protein
MDVLLGLEEAVEDRVFNVRPFLIFYKKTILPFVDFCTKFILLLFL